VSLLSYSSVYDLDATEIVARKVLLPVSGILALIMLISGAVSSQKSF
jgi:hypothetical protein